MQVSRLGLLSVLMEELPADCLGSIGGYFKNASLFWVAKFMHFFMRRTLSKVDHS